MATKNLTHHFLSVGRVLFGCVCLFVCFFMALGSGWIKHVNQQGGKHWQWRHDVKSRSVVCARWRRGGYCTQHGTSITSLIPPLTGYRGNDCSASVNQCVSNPCDPEGTLLCEELANTYRCVCQYGLTGPHCKTPINHCVDGLCQHGAACVDLSGGFKCDCLPGRFTIQQGVFSNGGSSSN